MVLVVGRRCERGRVLMLSYRNWAGSAGRGGVGNIRVWVGSHGRGRTCSRERENWKREKINRKNHRPIKA